MPTLENKPSINLLMCHTPIPPPPTPTPPRVAVGIVFLENVNPFFNHNLCAHQWDVNNMLC